MSVASDLDAQRGARLLFDAELASGLVDAETIAVDGVLGAVRPRPVPAAPLWLAQDVMRKLGRLDHERAVDAPLVAARRALLGERAAAA